MSKVYYISEYTEQFPKAAEITFGRNNNKKDPPGIIPAGLYDRIFGTREKGGTPHPSAVDTARAGLPGDTSKYNRDDAARKEKIKRAERNQRILREAEKK